MLELARHTGRVVGPHFGPHFAWFGPLMSLLVVALLVVGAILIVRTFVNRPQGGTASRGPLEILEERFARGEIDEDEFRTRRDALRG